MLNISFEYRDELSRGKWRKQSCTVKDLETCKKIYGLGTDVPEKDYKIISVEEVSTK